MFDPPAPTEELRTWRVHDLGSEFVLTTARSLPDDQIRADVPALADSIN